MEFVQLPQRVFFIGGFSVGEMGEHAIQNQRVKFANAG